ncbi:MAG TPA: sortase [Candidatus Dormibacteraeota bacterium]|nr:sortase [Candidatus Dormibacteraeota bacterium]
MAVWLLSFPLVTSHPASIATASAANPIQRASSDAARRGLLKEEQALAALQVLATAAASPLPLVAAPVASAIQPVAPPAPQPRPALVARANTIVIPRLGLSQPVGWYSDCLGRAPVPRWGTWRWSCAGANNIYVMAHNPGVFTPILGLRAGDIVLYGDPSGRVHTYRVSSTTIVANTQMWPLGATPSSSLTLQTCWTWDGSRDFIVRAVES